MITPEDKSFLLHTLDILRVHPSTLSPCLHVHDIVLQTHNARLIQYHRQQRVFGVASASPRSGNLRHPLVGTDTYPSRPFPWSRKNWWISAGTHNPIRQTCNAKCRPAQDAEGRNNVSVPQRPSCLDLGQTHHTLRSTQVWRQYHSPLLAVDEPAASGGPCEGPELIHWFGTHQALHWPHCRTGVRRLARQRGEMD